MRQRSGKMTTGIRLLQSRWRTSYHATKPTCIEKFSYLSVYGIIQYWEEYGTIFLDASYR